MKLSHYIMALALLMPLKNSHSAVHLSSSKTGSAIIVPFYTVSNQMYTMLSLNNTTDDNKAVKIHFKEAKSGDLLASFNVYLTGQDMWTMTTGQVPSINGGRMRMVSNDQSCTVGFPNDEDITVEADWLWENGTIEIIEMGTVDHFEAPANFRNCEQLNQMWQPGQAWAEDSERVMSAATGGLHAEVTLMDVESGHSANIPIIHMDGFFGEDNIQHTPSGEPTPNLSTGTKDSLLTSNGQVIKTTWPTGYEAVSALLTNNTIINEFNSEEEVAAKTEWIISIPTLHYHLNSESGVTSPFERYLPESSYFWFPTLYTNKDYFNREGLLNNHYPCSACSPIVPELLGHSVSNMVMFRLADDHNLSDPIEYPSTILTTNATENTVLTLTTYDPYEIHEYWSYKNGKIRLELSTESLSRNDRGVNSQDSDIQHIYHGLPVVGFAYTKFTNAAAQPGLLAQYAFIREHFGEKKVTIGDQ